MNPRRCELVMAAAMALAMGVLGALSLSGTAGAGAPMRLAQAGNVEEGGQGGYIPPSMVYRIAMQYVPGCTVLRVSLDHASETYAVKLKRGGEVKKLLVNARTGEVMGD